ncbi:MAG TPA: hypothetical protein DEQ47_00245 [Solibacterales bacterium]|nr:hypothetical protein [Bryobacterales bacterium]
MGNVQTYAKLVLLAVASSLMGRTVGIKNSLVTPVQGESWLSHLGRPFNESNMGRTGELGPPPPVPGQVAPPTQPKPSPGFTTPFVTLRGSDLFRMNCQGCHRESGRGAPPEINSVIDPVRATSVAVITERMKKSGGEMNKADVIELAKQSKALLLLRLHKGGQDMPPPVLREAEIAAVFDYLEQLSGVPGAEKKQLAVKEPIYRVGEQIVKATCHTCHDAAGPNPSPQTILDGAIPPLSSLTARVSLAEFVRKVTKGAPITMGTPPMSYRGRMPVFGQLSEDEAAAAYQYLGAYPPISRR